MSSRKQGIVHDPPPFWRRPAPPVLEISHVSLDRSLTHGCDCSKRLSRTEDVLACRVGISVIDEDVELPESALVVPTATRGSSGSVRRGSCTARFVTRRSQAFSKSVHKQASARLTSYVVDEAH
jgi:hypothetical protein